MTNIYIPYGEIPKTRYSGQKQTQWSWADKLGKYQKNPHPRYGPSDITYNFNEHGYRSDDFFQRKDINILFLGCSLTYGLCLPLEETYPYLLCRDLEKKTGKSVNLWNLGLPGRSNDYISRISLLALPILKPDLFFVYFTERSRREFIGVDNNYYRFNTDRKLDLKNPVKRMLNKAMYTLTSPSMDEITMLKNYKLVEMMSNNLGIKFLFTGYKNPFNGIENFINPESNIKFELSNIDSARDHIHPGREANKIFSQQALPFFENLSI